MTQTRRLPPREELINLLEYEEVARGALPPAVFARIEGSDRAAFDRMTFRPRMCIPTLDLDLTIELFGESHFTPIVAGPIADQRQFRTEGELATVRGASAAKAAAVVSSRSSVPIAELTSASKTPLWFAISTDERATARPQIERALAAGCKLMCITVTPGRVDWRAVDEMRKGLDTPIAIKGIATVADAQAAMAQGAQGVVVSTYGATSRGPAAVEVLPAIADAIGSRATLLVDGSFRRGSDVLKALILGARGVLVARPLMWALAAYGSAGVQSAIEVLQSDLARQLGALGVSNLQGLTRSHLKIHRT
jgi:4-hydroxymandelate oxidase